MTTDDIRLLAEEALKLNGPFTNERYQLLAQACLSLLEENEKLQVDVQDLKNTSHTEVLRVLREGEKVLHEAEVAQLREELTRCKAELARYHEALSKIADSSIPRNQDMTAFAIRFFAEELKLKNE